MINNLSHLTKILKQFLFVIICCQFSLSQVNSILVLKCVWDTHKAGGCNLRCYHLLLEYLEKTREGFSVLENH